ncbi:MAG TPA: hypothetical protein VLX68_10910 [Chitinivibrionales bacterium]|nr:hypothetical protein [Chitinivibrionales bacterium]
MKATRSRISTALRPACVTGICYAALAFAEPPPALPGDEITGDMNASVRRDTASVRAPTMSPYAPEWYTEAVKTWDAPPVSQQVDEDETSIPIGKGAVFVPRMGDPSLEPDVQIADSNGKVLQSGKPGKKFCLIPGTYSVHFGSGSTKQRLVKWVVIEEGKTLPLYPTWAGLQVDVVSESNIPFRGSYEMVRLDEFEPFGRTYGRDPNLGERVNTWILNPGLYKIFGTGGSYNAVSSFVTVRLLPGELTHFSVVEDSVTGKITSGGVTVASEASRRFASHWRYGLDLGGSILFNTSNDTNNSAIVFLTNLRVNHSLGKGEWDTKFFFDEEFNFTNLRVTEINNTSDDFRVYSLYVWRFMPWLGPYGRMQFETNFFPVYDRFQESSQYHMFLLTGADSVITGADSTAQAKRLKPSFSPMDIELGIGANVDAITSGVFDGKFKVGFGYSQRNTWDQFQDVDTGAIKTKEQDPRSIFTRDTLDSLLSRFHGNYKVVQQERDNTVISYGPETSINAALRLERWITAEGEVIVQFPIIPIIKEHMLRPTYWVNTTVSWRIAQSVTLDYLYTYQYSQPLSTDPKVDLSQHRIWLRFSFNTSR